MKGKRLKVTRSMYTVGVNECRLNLMMTSMIIGRPQQTRKRTTTRISIFITCNNLRTGRIRVMAYTACADGYVVFDGTFIAPKILSLLSDWYVHIVETNL